MNDDLYDALGNEKDEAPQLPSLRVFTLQHPTYGQVSVEAHAVQPGVGSVAFVTYEYVPSIREAVGHITHLFFGQDMAIKEIKELRATTSRLLQ